MSTKRKHTAAIVIPARLKSSRLPGKVLADIQGHPMLWHAYQRCLEVKRAQAVYVATDSDEVKDVVESWGGTVFMTSADCPSGTARIASMAHELDVDLIANVQADEPLIQPDLVDDIIEAFDYVDSPVVSAVYRLPTMSSILSPHIVKVIRSHTGFALYMSRSPVPFVRDAEQTDWVNKTDFWGQVNVYVFRKQVLLDFDKMPPSELEEIEKVEQLRFLEAGIPWYSIESSYETIPVDTPEDLEKVRKIMAGRSAN